MARGAFWTIIIDEQPTAFRAPVREDLLPTLKQLQRQHPTAVIKWFQRGRLWETPGDAMDAAKPPRRGPGWRPGGEHKDPRDQYKVPRDVKRARWAKQAAEGRGPWMKDGGGERRSGPPREGERAAWKPSPDGTPRKPGGKRPFAPRGERAEGERRERPASGDRPAWRPKQDGDGASGAERPRSPRPAGDRPAWRPTADGDRRPAGDKPAWRPKQDGDRASGAERPRSPRPAGDRPAWRPKADGDRRPAGDKPAWRPKPAGGDRPFTPREPRGGKTGWTPTGERPPRPARPEGRERPAGPRADWRERRGPGGDAAPRAGGQGERSTPKPPPKKGKTWRVGELPPADRKKKRSDES